MRKFGFATFHMNNMEKFNESLLLDNQEDNDQNAALEELMKLYAGENVPSGDSATPNYKTVAAEAQFCIKTKLENNDKVFLNFCTADHVPAPKDITDQELIELLDSDDPSQFRVPMALGEPHVEVDKSGKGCTAYDIVINYTFCEKINSNNLFMGFFMSVIMEGLDNKYGVKLSREWVKLKNKKCMGTIQMQNMRTESKPWIMEMDPSMTPSAEKPAQSQRLISEVKDTPTVNSVEPKYRIVREPVTGHPEFLSAEIELPEIKNSKALTLDIGEDCIILNSRSKVYHLSLYLPYDLVQKECGAQFDKQSRKLTLTLPVVPQSDTTAVST